ncbi:Uma2 family endonuclease [Trichothermofontia sichuanensis B231]|uniref:Uma2 family endonuclease n=1 Tax=Trichothermofontia sichuanensis TaxID=3045816 RepID=UPI0022485536|nr:Uma2 family endonuclease [Trichothermofontia sichuanensis]UZQ56262.1 Uma2 family endonuclease [Trichothermofontia sichuanensis B231]
MADYWVVNLRAAELMVYRQSCDGDYQLIQHLTTGRISPLAFPDVEINLAHVFAC